jgi:CelD/BcsL family acetyltransferase involved in cellulose biosynthesis
LSRAPGEIVVRTARTEAEVAALRPVWEKLGPSDLNADPDYFSEVVAGRPGARPHLVLVEQEGEPRALAVARIEQTELPIRFGYRVVVSPSLRMLNVVYQGVLGDPDEVALEALLRGLMDSLEAGEADALRLRSIAVRSPLHTLAIRLPPRHRRQHVSARSVHWRVELPDSYDDYMRGLRSSVRKNYSYNRRRLEREFGDRLSVRRFRSTSDLDEFFAHAGEVAAKAYQRHLGAGIADTPAQRALLRTTTERGWFRAVVVYDAEQPVAFWHGYAYRGAFVTDTPGYDPAYRRYGIGAYALLRLIEDLCADADVRTLDFGFGDADYKERLADRSWEEEDVLVFAPTARGVGINAARTALGRLDELAKRVLARTGVLQRVKRRWRDRRRSGAASQDAGAPNDS